MASPSTAAAGLKAAATAGHADGEKLVARGVSGLRCPSPLRKGKKDGNNRMLYISFLTASLPAPLQDITI
jgi:hypothetical protein